MKRFLVSPALLCVLAVACGEVSKPVDTSLPDDATTVAAAPVPKPPAPQADLCKGAECRVLTASGWGGIRAGMTVDAAMRASGLSLQKPGHYDEAFADEPGTLEACNIYGLVGAPSNVSVFVEKGLVTSIGTDLSKEPQAATFITDRGVKLGDPESAVRRAYKKLKTEPDIYSEPPDKKLFARGDDGNGIKFSIVGGKVDGIHVGGSSIQYVEGCL